METSTVAIVWLLAFITIVLVGIITDKLYREYSELKVGYEALFTKCGVLEERIVELESVPNHLATRPYTPPNTDMWGRYYGR